jgi:hypothetical protein|tara:strand:+ start:2754 stop:2966 length:213 start_codon:yes stop_codon:yes gene_type:complete
MERRAIKYDELINPQVFFEGWSEDQFFLWVTRPGVDLAYLETTLKNLEFKQMYERCSILKELIETYYENH